MKFKPKNTYNVRNAIGKWDEFRSITEKDLIKLFKKRKGWKIKKRAMHHLLEFAGGSSQLGIDLKATYNNISISIIAGEGSYSTPEQYQTEYSSVEVALLKNGKVTPFPIDIPNYQIKSDINKYGLAGYVNLFELKSIIEGIENYVI